jgi:hypothetical protein
MARYLVVANQTLGGEPLNKWLSERSATGQAGFRMVVPVTETDGTHQWDFPPIDRFVPDARALAHTMAEARLERELARLRLAGVDVDGEVVDANPIDRIRELVQAQSYEAVLVSTLPRPLSRWLFADLPHRLSRALAIPVIHIEGTAGPSI